MDLTHEESLALRRDRLEDSHIAPLSDFVRGLRAAAGKAVPWFYPLDGGIERVCSC